MTHAFTHLVERELAAWRAALAGLRDTADLPAATAVLASVLDPPDPQERARQLALWELYLQAGRDRRLQALAAAWSDGCVAIAGELLRHLGIPADAARLLVPALDGVLLQNLVEQRSDAHAFAVQAARALLEAARGPT